MNLTPCDRLRQTGINDFLQGGHRGWHGHFIVAFQLKLAVLDRGEIIEGEAVLCEVTGLVELLARRQVSA